MSLTRDKYAMTLIYKLIYGMYDMTLIYIYTIYDMTLIYDIYAMTTILYTMTTTFKVHYVQVYS